ncbi:sensor histidine kinase [Phenylobacterium sp.]|uniref:sensor histidine kinase n=1 Tax=Phenylobacterium sp. TaxID=1871053 RepID=UPI002ED77F6C
MPAAPREVAERLGLAIVASSMAPLLLLDGDFRVLAASTSFCRTFGTEPVPGEPVFNLGDGEWNVPQLRSLLRVTLSGAADIDAYEMDLDAPAYGPLRLVLNAHRLDYGLDGAPRILLTVVDVTKARRAEALQAAALAEKDDLLRQRALLLQEVRHRVANSLQIIASVLLQNARRVSSEESRGHLRDAHQRVMSVAALQHQLAASSVEGVPLRDYLSHLCESIAASMIADPSRISLTVEVDDTVVEADVSISIGLIVTELVINALKHAFPHDRRGAIVVVYAAGDGDWSLSVTDDGVGMPPAPQPRAGLGTSIVEALSRQLQAVASVEDRRPGAAVSIVHKRAVVVVAPLPI